MNFRAHIIEKIRDIFGIYYQLQRNGTAILRYLFNEHAFLN